MKSNLALLRNLVALVVCAVSISSVSGVERLLTAVTARYRNSDVAVAVNADIQKQVHTNGIIVKNRDRIPSSFFRTDGIEGSIMSWLVKNKDTGQIELKILFTSIGLRALDGVRMRDGTIPAHLSNEFAKVVAGMIDGIQELSREFPEIKVAEIKASTVNPRLAETLKRIGFNVSSMDEPWATTWYATMNYPLLPK